jgi:hypothetical protein
MERDNVLEAWASFEAQLKRTERLNDLIVIDSLKRRAQSPLSRERFFLWLEAGINLFAVIVLGSFAGDRLGSVSGMCAVILMAALLALNAVLIGIAVALSRLDFDNPVVSLQTELARLKLRRVALVAVTLSAAPLLWAPLMVVLVTAAGVDPVRALGVPFIAANVAFGAFVAGAALLIARLLGERLRKAPWMAGWVDALSGGAYREAADYLDTIERYREG